MQILQSIQNRIYEIRGERVMLDFDLAILYEVTTKALNQAVKPNILRFPKDFMFRLTPNEWQSMRSQNITAYEPPNTMEAQIITNSQNKRNTEITPYAFTVQGVIMLCGILRSDKAINMNIAIIKVHIKIGEILSRQGDLKEQLREIKETLGENDGQLNSIYDAIENLIDEKAAQRKWEDRKRIGFNK